MWRELRDLAVTEKPDEDLAKKLLAFKEQNARVDVVAIEHEVLSIDGSDIKSLPDGLEKHVFKIGDRILLRVKSYSEAYVYVFHRGSSGAVNCLLPTDPEHPSQISSGDDEFLPGDGRTIEFRGPAGDEELIVVASETRLENLEALAGEMFGEREKPDGQRQGTANRLSVATADLSKRQNGARIYEFASPDSLPKSLAQEDQNRRSIFSHRPTRGPGLTVAELGRDGSEPLIITMKLRSE